uniref:pyruvate kinase n=1 Tax=Jaculus jaculus TaxID=51337 RepID=A0A8C5K4Z8_JACJA
MPKLHSKAGTASIQTQQLHAATADSFLEHECGLDIDWAPITATNTSIICTIGPALRAVEMLNEMIKSGMNVDHLNFSHGTHEYHAETIKILSTATESFAYDPILYRPVAVALDTKGPEIPTRLIKGKGTRGRAEEWSIDFLVTGVENGGSLGRKRGVNLPRAAVDLPAVSEKDVQDLNFGVEQYVDMVLASFIRKAADAHEVRKVLGEKGKNIKIISKIENHEGVRRFEEILEVSDGIMVVRGDLGIEIPAEKVFLALQMIGQYTGKYDLESLPTRAEGSHVSNAVLDGADCIMLSEETAKEDYPLEAALMQHLIAHEAEAAIYHLQLFEGLRHLAPITTEAAAVGAVEASFKCYSGAIIVLTKSGRRAHQVARYSPRTPIIAVKRNPQTAVRPICTGDDVQDAWAEDTGGVVIRLTEWHPGSGFTNTVHVVPVP